MEKITSFCIDHTKLFPGLYLSRTDGDIVTYDVRCVRPNTPPFLPVAGIHTVEHLFATFVRNSELKDGVVYFGPMGCRTGFYFLTRGISHEQAISLTQRAWAFIADFDGEVPGLSAVECGNYREHDLETARAIARNMSEILRGWTPQQLSYPC